MIGVDQRGVWQDESTPARQHAICEFRHEATTIHQKTYVDERYKLTVYYNQTYGELFDLKEDPNEIRNLWDDVSSQPLKQELLLKYIWAELSKESMPMPRIGALKVCVETPVIVIAERHLVRNCCQGGASPNTRESAAREYAAHSPLRIRTCNKDENYWRSHVQYTA